MMRLVAIAFVAAACSKPVVFQGETSLKITAAPPAAAPVAAEPPRVELRDNKIVIQKSGTEIEILDTDDASYGRGIIYWRELR